MNVATLHRGALALAAAAGVGIALAAPLARAEHGALGELAERGQYALRSGSYADASAAFTAGLQQAQRLDDAEWESRFRFYRGNASLVEAEAAAEPGALAKRAVEDYRAVLAERPAAGSAMVNLAQALALLEQHDEAEQWFRKAIALNDKRQDLYRQRYAEFLLGRDSVRAEAQLKLVVASRPSSRKAHQQLLQTYLEPRNAARLAEYLLARVESGDVLRAQQAALDALVDPAWPARYKGDLMNVVGVSLAHQDIAPEEFAASNEARTLHRIAAADPTLRLCIEELLRTLERGAEPVRYSWWTADEERAATLSALLRSLARSRAQRGDSERAERLYRDAIDVSGSADPKAVQDLVDFYATRGDIDGINEVSRTYEFALFQGKGAAYARNDVRAIYDYHRSLAAIYANQAQRTGDWGSRGDATSAAFQLEHAYRTAVRSGEITPDPQLVDHLAQSYAVTRSASAALDLRLDAAAAYTREGNTRAAQSVLAPLAGQAIPDADRPRYERLRAESATPQNQALRDVNAVQPALRNVPAAPDLPDTSNAPNVPNVLAAPVVIEERVRRGRPDVLQRRSEGREPAQDDAEDVAPERREDEGP